MNGTTTVFEIRLLAKSSMPSGSQKVRRLTTMLATITAPIVITITPNTLQPLPLTSSRLRPNDSPADLPSSTIVGTISDQIVRRKSPGMIRRMSPSAIPRPARIPATIRAGRRGCTRWNISPIERSCLPSRTSWTASTSAPWSQKVPTMLASAPMIAPSQPRSSAKHERDQAENDVDDQRERDEGAPVALVELPRFANDCPRLH